MNYGRICIPGSISRSANEPIYIKPFYAAEGTEEDGGREKGVIREGRKGLGMDMVSNSLKVWS